MTYVAFQLKMLTACEPPILPMKELLEVLFWMSR